MARTARPHFALLGLIAWRPMSGYDIKKLCEAALAHFWSESYGQIYPALRVLVEGGLASVSTDKQSGRRGRKVYKITAAGRDALSEWMKQPGDLPRLRDELKLKFFLCSRRDTNESIRLLQEYEAQQRAHLEMLRHSERLIEAALKSDEHLENLLDLREALGWDGNTDAKARHKELTMFYLTLRAGVMASEVRVAWVAESLCTLRGTSLARKTTIKSRASE